MNDKRARVGIGRRFGASPEARERMKEHDATCIWGVICRKCGADLRGTPSQLKEHKCPQKVRRAIRYKIRKRSRG